MLRELIIADFAIIDQLHVQFGPGFNVLTGETGAGKSIVIDAVNVLLGGRVDSEMIRAGANLAHVEGLFELDETSGALLQPIIDAEGLEGDEAGVILLGREVRREGRHVCRLNGRAVSLSVYRTVTEHLIDIHGQGDHLSLFRVKEHLSFLDRYGGLLEQRRRMAELVRSLRQTRRELQRLLQDEREIARRVDLLQYQVEEISAASLAPGEDKELKAERNRLANAENLMNLATGCYRLLQEGEENQMSALDLIGLVVRDMSSLERIDPDLQDSRQMAEEIEAQAEDLARLLRTYCDNIEYNPARLQEVEERLALISNLKRKYGESIEDILAFKENAARELDGIAHSAEKIEDLRRNETVLVSQASELAADLSQRRRELGDRLATEIERELADLQMDRARVRVEITHEEAADGLVAGDKGYAFDETGYDLAEFLIAPNIGEPLRPLVKTASGGEASRLMLALKVVLSGADPVPTLIFDEIDSGIGGRAGGVVGRKLWGLTSAHQVLCVTHLPQIAAFADAHYRAQKRVVEGRTLTEVGLLEGSERIGELAQMLGSNTEAAWHNAQEMSNQVAAQKEESLKLKGALGH